jgi:3-oxoacyl-[acyl-carrier protein] reductase
MARGLRAFEGTVGVVTGASSGIGAELARQLAKSGMKVAVLARRLARLEELVAEIAQSGREALPLACDVTDRAAVEGAIAAVLERWGRVDLLVNNAGFGRHVLFKDHDPADVEAMIRTNLMGTLYATRAVLPVMRANRKGFLVNISSVAGKLGQPDEAVYSATKFAVTGLSEALTYELAPLGIHVLTVYPALVRTEMFTPDVVARMPSRLQRMFIEAPDFARAVLRALRRGDYELTPSLRVRIAYVMRLLLPAVYRRIVTRLRMKALPDVTS